MRQIIRLIARPALALALLAGAGTTAMAQTASPAGAAGLQAMIQERLTAATRTEPDQFRLERVPEVEVTAQGDRYAVTIPKLRVLTADGWLLEAPLVEVEVIPEAGGGWQVEAEIPQPLSVFSERGFRAGDLTLGQQKLRARWSADGYLLTAADLSLGKVAFTPMVGGGAFSLGSFSLKLEPKSISGESWTGLFNLTLANLSWRDPAGVQRLAVGNLSVKGDATSLDLTRFAHVARAWRGGTVPAANQAERMANALKLDVNLTGFREVRDDGRATKLDNATGKLSLTNLEGDRAGLRLDWRHSGLDRRGPDANPALTPASADLSLAGERMPGQPLLTMITLYAASEDEAARKAAWNRLSDAMARAGSQISITRMDMQNATSAASGTGDFRFGSQSPRGVTGQADITMRGIDRLIAAVNATGGAKATGTAIALYALQGLGQPADGGTHRYEVRLMPDGRMLVNGADMASIAGMMGR
ncbi:hypothetical protein [Niveispirillum irakense]|uniref:hypothetical protein n=1 Tax=Niveispirillum irakense TaxID=34011 RepID=UPI000428ADFB|nr:hypothetical protein [Niveispirillum irakense]